jgi:hypothetical protein
VRTVAAAGLAYTTTHVEEKAFFTLLTLSSTLVTISTAIIFTRQAVPLSAEAESFSAFDAIIRARTGFTHNGRRVNVTIVTCARFLVVKESQLTTDARVWRI